MVREERGSSPAKGGAASGLEQQFWTMADALRGHMDAAEYKHVALGLIFLKYISDAFAVRYDELVAEEEETGADPEDRDEYLAEGVFWVPPEARWDLIKGSARQPNIGVIIDGAMDAIERENPTLRDVLPKGYSRPTLPATQVGRLVDVVSDIGLNEDRHRQQDLLGRVYEYFLGQFASAEGKRGGEFYTPRSVVRVLVEMLAPYRGRVYDPCCGSGGMFVQSERFVEEHSYRIGDETRRGQPGDIAIYGQESNPTTWKLAKMNLALRGIEADLGRQNADTFHNDLHPDLKADYILANPPFNISDWGGERLRDDRRWQFGAPPVGNANYAWVQHIISHLAPNGVAGFVLANGSLSSNTGGEGEIRRKIIEADLVDCIVAMPGQLFYSTQIPVSLWFLARNKVNGHGLDGAPLRDRRGETLFIDARALGYMENRTLRNLSEDDIARIAGTYHAWRGDGGEDPYVDVPGFCRAATMAEIADNAYMLSPGRYVEQAAVSVDEGDFVERLQELSTTLEAQMVEAARLNSAISEILAGFQLSRSSS
jgi:type I restriction enzyme M protein